MLELQPEQLELPPELKDVILSEKCVAFVGSGLSRSYPSWLELVTSLCERCGSSHRVDKDSTSDHFLDAAQDAKDCAEDEYYSFLGETFGRPAGGTDLTYVALFALPFDSYLTVNLDPLVALEAGRARLPCSDVVKVFPELDRKFMGDRTVHYLHGLVEEGTTPTDETIVLSRGEFDAAYSDNSNLMRLLVSTLVDDPIVFVGCRLLEPVLPYVFRICKKQQQCRQRRRHQQNISSKPPPRFILAAMPEMEREGGQLDEARSKEQQQEEERRYRDMDITPVWYRASGSDHSLLRRTLDKLAGFEPPRVFRAWEGD